VELDKEKWSLDHEILRYIYPLNHGSVVIDLGGYEGKFADNIFDRYGCNIFVYEPIPLFYENIKERFKDNDRIKVYNYGALDKSCTSEIYIQRDGTSLFKESSDKINVSLSDIKDIIDQYSFVDLIKINTEGSEYKILNRIIENNQQVKLKNIQVQFHNFVKNCYLLRNKFREILSETHRLTYDYPFIWENWELK
jgi:FkbM family methyltransferase